MLGAIIGDIVGSRFEFNNTFDYNFELFSDKCDFTDDTICTIAIADAILRNKNYAQSLYDWCNKYPNPKGAYGGSFQMWLSADSVQPPYNSFGNGSAMRVSPTAMAFNDEREVAFQAAESAKVTHNHKEGVKGAVAVSQMIFNLKNNKDEAVKEDKLTKIATLYYGKNWDKNLLRKGVFDVTCQGCVPLAFKILQQSESFEDAVRKAVSYGGDSDTLGAIVGSMAEFRFGIENKIKAKALKYLPKEMQDVVEKFYTTFVK